MKRILIACILLLCTAGLAFGDDAGDGAKLSVRTFQFKYKDADRAAGIIKPLMSTDGSMSIQPAANALVVTDRPENLKAVAAALADYDAPARPVKLTVRIISAARVDNPTRTPDDLRDLATKLTMLRYNSIESLGEAEIQGHEGEPGLVDLKNGYRADFKFGEYDPSSDSIKVTDFRLSKLQNDQLTQLYKASLNLKVGTTVVIGAGKPQGNRAVLIAFIARR